MRPRPPACSPGAALSTRPPEDQQGLPYSPPSAPPPPSPNTDEDHRPRAKPVGGSHPGGGARPRRHSTSSMPNVFAVYPRTSSSSHLFLDARLLLDLPNVHESEQCRGGGGGAAGGPFSLFPPPPPRWRVPVPPSSPHLRARSRKKGTAASARACVRPLGGGSGGARRSGNRSSTTNQSQILSVFSFVRLYFPP